jgi:hypothetical protein
MHIMYIMYIMTFFRIVVCFNHRHECTFEGLGSSVRCSRWWKKKQNPSVPDRILRHNEITIINSWRPNHDEIQSMTAIKWFRWKRITANPLHTLVLSVTEHQTIKQRKMRFGLADWCGSNVLRSSVAWKIMNIIICMMRKIVNRTKINSKSFFLVRSTRTQVNTAITNRKLMKTITLGMYISKRISPN